MGSQRGRELTDVAGPEAKTAYERRRQDGDPGCGMAIDLAQEGWRVTVHGERVPMAMHQ